MSTINMESFIHDQFNDETIDNQILEQEKIIATSQREISRLQSLRDEQENKPWFQWDGVRFTHVGYYHSDGYRSHRACRDTYKSYEEFAKVIVREFDPDDRSSADDSDFIIVSPNGGDYYLKDDEIRNFPLVKEFFERKELRESMKYEERELDSLEENISRFGREIESTDKYTESYIQSLREKQEEVIKERDQLKEKIENGVTARRLIELNELLREIDEEDE